MEIPMIFSLILFELTSTISTSIPDNFMFRLSTREKIDHLIEAFVRPADLTMFFEYSLKLCDWPALVKNVIVEKDGQELSSRARDNESIAVGAYDVVMKIGPSTGFGVYGCRFENTSFGQWNITNRPADVHFCTHRKLKHRMHDHTLFLGETVSIQAIKNGEQHLFVECPPGGHSGPFRGFFIRRLDLYGEDEEISEILSDTCDQKHRAFIHNRKIINGQNGHGILIVELGPKQATYVQIVTFNATATLTKECTKESIYALTCRFPPATPAFSASMSIFKDNTSAVTGASVQVSMSITKPGNYSCHTSIVFTGSTFTYSLERRHSTDFAWKYISHPTCLWTDDTKMTQHLEKGSNIWQLIMIIGIAAFVVVQVICLSACLVAYMRNKNKKERMVAQHLVGATVTGTSTADSILKPHAPTAPKLKKSKNNDLKK